MDPRPAGASKPHVVIVGGGFGGLEVARTLRDAPVRITLIDRNDHHLFQPLLYQVATAGFSPADIAAPIRNVLRHQQDVEVIMAEVTGVDKAGRRVLMGDRSIAYDYLVLATGARDGYFGHDEWEQYAPGLKSIPQATEIRRRNPARLRAGRGGDRSRRATISADVCARRSWADRCQDVGRDCGTGAQGARRGLSPHRSAYGAHRADRS